jgi:hypothetical protein
VSKKTKLLEKLRSQPKDFTWDEATALMRMCGFKLLPARGGGSGRMFVHEKSHARVRLHEPHPRKTLLPYMVELLKEALEETGELQR